MLNNRIKILRTLQQKTERSIEETRVKARKLDAINKLRELQQVQVRLIFAHQCRR